jgi:hypothetical protein
MLIKFHNIPSGIIPAKTRRATTTPCQKEKKIMALTQRNFGNGLSINI